MSEFRVLIIGASGFIGNKLYCDFKKRGVSVKGTYCSSCNRINKEDRIYFDLRYTDFSEIKKIEKPDYAIFCHGISNIDRCKGGPLASLINVENTIRLLGYCKDISITPIYLSTNMVFSGKDKLPIESDEMVPATEYGAQKKKVENFITSNLDNYVILRLTKVFGVEKSDKTIFTSWLDKLLANERITVVSDIFISPVYIEDVIKAVGFMAEHRVKGVFNLGGPEVNRISYFAEKIINFFKFNRKLLNEASIDSFDFKEKRPLFNSLDSKKIRQYTGINLTTIDDCIGKMGINYGLRREVI